MRVSARMKTVTNRATLSLIRLSISPYPLFAELAIRQRSAIQSMPD